MQRGQHPFYEVLTFFTSHAKLTRPSARTGQLGAILEVTESPAQPTTFLSLLFSNKDEKMVFASLLT